MSCHVSFSCSWFSSNPVLFRLKLSSYILIFSLISESFSSTSFFNFLIPSSSFESLLFIRSWFIMKLSTRSFVFIEAYCRVSEFLFTCVYNLSTFVSTTIHKIFETNSSFHAKWRTTGNVLLLFFNSFLLLLSLKS